MAGEWIAISTDLLQKREVLLIASQTGWSRYEVVGRLVQFWSWVSAETADGTIPGLTIEALSSCQQFDQTFLAALKRVGWLMEDETGLHIPHFERWLSASAKKRLQEAYRKRLSREPVQPVDETGSPSSIRPQNVRDLSAICPQNVREISDKKRTIGEERRGEERDIPSIQPIGKSRSISVGEYSEGGTEKEECGESVFDSSPPNPPTEDADSVPMEVAQLVFPCKGSPTEWRIDPPFFKLLCATYPNLDVLAELRKAHLWLTVNPTRRKKEQGMPRFIVAWMNRAAEHPNAAEQVDDIFA